MNQVMKTAVVVTLIIVVLAESSLAAVTPFIVGGNDAKPGQFPYMVSLGNINIPNSHGCGGGILNQRWILSAAHCFILTPPSIILATVGAVERAQGVSYRISRIINHPRFVPNILPFYTSNWHDISVLKTEVPIVFNAFTQPIPIGRRHILGNMPATAAGFGSFFTNITINSPLEDLVMADHLQYMETQIITHNDCSRRAALFATLFPFDPIRPIIHPLSHICTLQPRGVGLCFGDSGSMLVANGAAVGVIVSGIRLCAQAAAAPDIYTRVSSYSDWIDSYIHDLD